MAARGFRMVRYADDFVILCRTREDADAALDEVRAWVSGERPDAASREDACRRLPGAGARVRVPRLPVRSRPAPRAQEEPGQAQGQHPGEDGTQPRRQPRVRHRRSQSGAARLVRLLQACPPNMFESTRRIGPASAAIAAAEARMKRSHVGFRARLHRPLAQCLLREAGLFALHPAWRTARQSR